MAATFVAAPALAGVKVPEGTEFSIRLEDALSSSTATEGDRFTISLEEDVKLPDGTVLRAGYRGIGEVVEARDNGMLGKSGKLNVRLVYLKVGDERIKLRANKGAKGDVRVGATVATVILFWPAAPFIKGKDVSIKKGTLMTAFADGDFEHASYGCWRPRRSSSRLAASSWPSPGRISDGKRSAGAKRSKRGTSRRKASAEALRPASSRFSAGRPRRSPPGAGPGRRPSPASARRPIRRPARPGRLDL